MANTMQVANPMGKISSPQLPNRMDSIFDGELYLRYRNMDRIFRRWFSCINSFGGIYLSINNSGDNICTIHRRDAIHKREYWNAQRKHWN
jgi:hypothetical protein